MSDFLVGGQCKVTSLPNRKLPSCCVFYCWICETFGCLLHKESIWLMFYCWIHEPLLVWLDSYEFYTLLDYWTLAIFFLIPGIRLFFELPDSVLIGSCLMLVEIFFGLNESQMPVFLINLYL